MAGRRALVIGATGYLGSRLVDVLKTDSDNTVFGLSRRGVSSARGWRLLEGDMLDARLAGLLEELQPDEIYHVAGVDKNAPLKTQLLFYAEGTRHLFQAMRDSQISARVVVTGSAAVYGPYPDERDPAPMAEDFPKNPTSEYGVAKLVQDHVVRLYARHYDLPVMIARLFNLYGESPRRLVMASLASQIARHENQGLAFPRIRVRNLKGVRDMIHVEDAARGLVALAREGRPGEAYNLSTGEAVTVETLVNRLLAMSRLKEWDVVPEGPQYSDYSHADIMKITRETGWRSHISMEEGLRRELDHWREQVALSLV